LGSGSLYNFNSVKCRFRKASAGGEHQEKVRVSKAKYIGWTWAVLFVFLPLIAFAGEVDLPRTGQTTCYNLSGNVISCPGTGQDGDLQEGVAWPVPRFTDNGNGTVTDHLTGLIWLKNANCLGIRKTWDDAVGFCNVLASGMCGLTDGSVAGDWRLPNIVELESLLNAEPEDLSSWLNMQGFTNVQLFHYWSASTLAIPTNKAWGVYMIFGSVATLNKSEGYYVWPVRGGQNGFAITWRTGQTASYAAGDDGALQRGVAWPAARFTDNGNGTVTDHLTDLIWLKTANCSGNKTWQEALAYCNTLASGSCGLTDGSIAGDWRLPNRKELFSLIDFSRYNPALPQDHPFTNVWLSDYWSSGTMAYYRDYAWVVRMDYGEVYNTHKSGKYFVWPVRGGPTGPPGNLTILYPNGGESFNKRQNYNITWSSTGVTGAVAIDLYKGGEAPGFFVIEIAAAAPNTGSYPFNPSASLADGTDYMIRISADSDSVWDFSDSFFAIETPLIMGDINRDGYVDLTDAVISAQIAEGMTPIQAVYKDADINGDNRIGTEETIFSLESVAGLR
jgi:hypothetical protein